MQFSNLSFYYLYFLSGFIIIYYFLKGKKREKRISSLLFWRNLYRDKNTFSFHLKFTPDILFFIQMLILLLLVTALLQPILTRTGILEERVVLIIDRSVSMQATDIHPDRYSQAIEKAIDRVQGFSDRVEIALVDGAKDPQLLVDFTSDHDRIIDFLNKIEVTDTELDLDKTLGLARALFSVEKEANILFFTDGVFGERVEKQQINFDNIEIVSGSKAVNNTGIIEFDVREKSGYPGEYELFLTIGNFADEPVIVPISIRARNRENGDPHQGRILLKDRLSMKPGEEQGRYYTLRVDRRQFIDINLEVDDSFQKDNHVVAILGTELVDSFRVLLVSERNFFLENGLLVVPGIKVLTTTDTDFNQSEYDLVIFDGIKPPANYQGSGLYIGVEPVGILDEELISVQATGSISSQDSGHRILRFVNLRELKFRDYLAWSASEDKKTPGLTPLVSTPQGAIMVSGQVPDYKWVFIGFDLYKSNLPLQASFPVFLSNLINWFAPHHFNPGLNHIETSSVYEFTADNNYRPEKVFNPTGKEVQLVKGSQNYLIRDTYWSGFYRIVSTRISTNKSKAASSLNNTDDKKERYFAVNLNSRTESNLRQVYQPVHREKIREKGIKTIQLWTYILLLVLVLMIVEWYLYQKPNIKLEDW